MEFRLYFIVGRILALQYTIITPLPSKGSAASLLFSCCHAPSTRLSLRVKDPDKLVRKQGMLECNSHT